MIKSKKQMYIVVGVFLVVLMLFTTTYAFFNYTRTGVANTIKTGRISFTTGQTDTLNLTNVFPITREDAATDNTNSSELIVTITGDTTYSGGLEYLITVEDVHIETSTHKKVPIGIIVIPEKTGELGTNNANYFNESNDGGRGGDTSYYKVLKGSTAGDTINDGDYILVGYIRPGVAEVNGTIGIRAFIDKDKIFISNTYDGTESDNMGTPSSMATGKVVLTTTEWNALQGNNIISFKVKIQSNEGVWVGEPLSRNDLKPFLVSGNYGIHSVLSNDQNSSITEINFIRMSEEMINTHANLIDLSDENGTGMVKAWVDGTKLYIASPGETYFPVDSTYLLGGFPNVTRINFNNVNTSQTTNMEAMFNTDPRLASIDLSSFDTRSVTSMSAMFNGDTDLINLDLSYLNTSSVTNMSSFVGGCTNLESLNISGLGSNYLTSSYLFSGNTSLKKINMSNFNFGTQTSLSGIFSNSNIPNVEDINLRNAKTDHAIYMTSLFNSLTKLETIDLRGIDTSNVIQMIAMFQNDTSLTSIKGLEDFDTSKVTQAFSMFQNCTSLTTIDLSSFDTSSLTGTASMFAMGTNSNGTWTPSNNSLTTIYVGSGWDLSSTTNTGSMFYNCTHLVGGDGTTFDSNYTDKTYARVDKLPYSPGYLTYKKDNGNHSVNAMNVFPTNITGQKANIKEVYFKRMEMDEMQAKYTAASIKVDLTYNNEGKVLAWLETNSSDNTKYTMYIASDGDTYLTTGNMLFASFTNLTKINFSNINTSRVTNMSSMFSNCSSLQNINLTNFDTSNVTNMVYMFRNCTSFTNIDLTGLDTSSVTTMGGMFQNCSNLVSINMNGLGSDVLINIGDWFYSCSSLQEIHLSGFNFGIANLSNNNGFRNLTNLEFVDLSNANTSNVSSFYELFSGCTNLTYVNLTGINTSNVTNMGYMFNNCTSLTNLDLSSLDTSNVSNMGRMFMGCTNLTTIYVSNTWDVSNVTNYNYINMFNGCTSLVGGNGTRYIDKANAAQSGDNSYSDKTYAVIDDATHEGYLTLKNS